MPKEAEIKLTLDEVLMLKGLDLQLAQIHHELGNARQVIIHLLRNAT